MLLRSFNILLALSVLPATADESAPQSGAGNIVQYEVRGGGMLADGRGGMVVVMDISDSVSGELLASAWRF